MPKRLSATQKVANPSKRKAATNPAKPINANANKNSPPGLKSSYDAATAKNRRRNQRIELNHEDKILRNQFRDTVISNARNLRRNASIARWAINKHLDYVSTFSFQCRTGNAELDARVEDLIFWWDKPLNCDVSGRFSLTQLCRMWEGLRTTDGDCFVMKLSDGRVQTIEGDKVRTPTNLGNFTPGTIDINTYIHGVEITNSNKAVSYAVCDYLDGGSLTNTSGYVLKAIVPEQYVYHHGYFDRYEQVRGISPLASAINTFCDIYEAQEYALAKMKLSQILALKITRGSIPESDTAANPYSFDFSGPQAMELDPGDDAEFLESGNPSGEFQSFLLNGIQVAIKSLDIPFSFYSENYANYNGSRLALTQYEQSSSIKRQANNQLLTNLTLWRLSLFIQDGELVLPKGMTISDIRFEWIPPGISWLDPLKEAQSDTFRIANKTASRQQLCREHGKDWFDIIDQLAAEQAYMQEKGLSDSPAPAQAVIENPPNETETANHGKQNN